MWLSLLLCWDGRGWGDEGEGGRGVYWTFYPIWGSLVIWWRVDNLKQATSFLFGNKLFDSTESDFSHLQEIGNVQLHKVVVRLWDEIYYTFGTECLEYNHGIVFLTSSVPLRPHPTLTPSHPSPWKKPPRRQSCFFIHIRIHSVWHKVGAPKIAVEWINWEGALER